MPQIKNTLRIYIATPLGPGGQGGMDRLTDLIIEALKKRTDLAIQVVSLKTRGRRGILIGMFTFAHAVARFWLATRRGKVDLLHLNVAAGGSVYRKLILAQIASHYGIPYVVHLHGSRFHTFLESSLPQSRRATELLFAKSKHIIVLGQFWKRLITKFLPEAKDKITILPNATKPIAARHKRPMPAGIQITCLGQLGRRKGTFELIEALGRIAVDGNWKATIAGNGELDKCRSYVQQLGISDRVSIPGWLDSAGVDDILSQTDIFVLPSTAENLPMAILEAFAFGIAVVATPVGAIPEVIEHARNGMIVPVGDVDALANALRTLIENPKLRDRLGSAARADHERRYDICVYVTRLAAIWRTAAGGSSA